MRVLYINGQAADLEPSEMDDRDGFRVQVEDEAISSGYGPACFECDEVIEESGDGWTHAEDESQDEDHEARPKPFAWCNSAAIDFDADDETVTVSISVGDPRGAFTFQVRRIRPDSPSELAGRLIMHVPYPGEGFPHEETHEIRPGTFLIGRPVADA